VSDTILGLLVITEDATALVQWLLGHRGRLWSQEGEVRDRQGGSGIRLSWCATRWNCRTTWSS